jgi:general L-amino acid transport system ATP-binding protein
MSANGLHAPVGNPAVRPGVQAMLPIPVVELTGVNKWFGDLHVLRDIHLSARHGERIVICGPSGSGKSTLIRCINQLERHQSGQIRVDGVELTDDPRRIEANRRDVGMLFQQFNLFPHLTILENCVLAPRLVRKLSRDVAEAAAIEHLRRVRIPDQAHKYPNQLSGGQQQRAAIARALCMEPGILLLDEPTSALDPEMIKEVLDVLVDVAQERRTLLCVTHEMGFAREVADRVLFMDQGRIIEDAPPDRFFANPQHERTRQFLSTLRGPER